MIKGWSPRVRTVLGMIAALQASVGSSSFACAKDGATASKIERLASCGGFLEGAVIDRGGRLWVMDVSGGRILEVLPSGSCAERAHTGGHPNGARLGPDGRLYIADWKGLFAFDTITLDLTKVPLAYGAAEVTGLNDLSFDRHGGLYLTVPGKSDALEPSGRVFYRASDGRVSLFEDKLAYPNGIAVRSDSETVLVSEFARKRILALPAIDSTAPVKLKYVFSYTEGGVGADGILLDSEGRLFTANFGTRRVQMFAPDGMIAGRIELPASAGDWVTNLALAGDVVYITEAKRGEVWRGRLDAQLVGR